MSFRKLSQSGRLIITLLVGSYSYSQHIIARTGGTVRAVGRGRATYLHRLKCSAEYLSIGHKKYRHLRRHRSVMPKIITFT